MKNKKLKEENKNNNFDSKYFLKIILYFILGCLWIKIGANHNLPIPVGLVIGIIFASHEHFSIDKKIEYAILLVSCVLSFIAPIGFVLTVG